MAFRCSRILRSLCCAGILCLWGLAPGLASAQPAGTNTGNARFSTGMDIGHAYFFRGIRQEDEGFIAQPWGDATFKLRETDETSTSLAVGFWNSLHSGPTESDGPSENVTAWYRADFYTGLSLGLGGGYEAGVAYRQFMSPNDSFGTVKEITLSLGFDDSERWMGNFALAPHALLAIELDGQADRGTGEGVYLELGVEPGLTLQNAPVSVVFPVTLGLSLANYYEDALGNDSTYGFFDMGAVASYPLAISESYGSWKISGGLHLLFLGRSLEAFNDGNQVRGIASFGLSIEY